MVDTIWTRVSQVEYWDEKSSDGWDEETDNWNDKWTRWTVSGESRWSDNYEAWVTIQSTWG
jgi:hypothetical protein